MSTPGTNVSRRTAFIHDLRLTVNCLGVDGLVLYLRSAPDDSNLDSALLAKLADLLKMLAEEQELEYSRLAAPTTLDYGAVDEQPYAVIEEIKGSGDDVTSTHDSPNTYQIARDGEESVDDPTTDDDEWPIVTVSKEAFPELFPTKEVTEKRQLPKSFPNLEEFRGGVSLLGSGNFGLTFKSVLKGVPVVLKVSKMRSEEANRADYHEWSVSERLNPHPNVLQISGLCPSFENALFPGTGTTALIAPLKGNGGLREFFDNRKERNGDIMDMAFGMIAGIRSLHEQRVVHRDIAVRNFLVDCDGRVLLCDFGLTEFIPEGDDAYHGSSAEVLPWRNLAPESFSRVFSPKSDIWMYGLALVELLSKKQPWPGVKTCAELRKSFEEKKIQLPDIERFPQIIAEIVRDCLQFNPSDRPSADDIAERLVKWQFSNDDNDRDENGNTFFHKQIMQGSISKLNSGPPRMINGVNIKGETPLMLAKSEKLQRALLAYQRVPSCNSEPSRIPEYFHNIDVLGSLLKLAQNEDVEGIKSLGRFGLRDYAKQMYEKGGIWKGVTPLHIAAKIGNTVLLDVLMNLGLFDHRKVNSDGQTALHVAAIHGHAGVIEKLLSLQESFESKEDIRFEAKHEASTSHLVNVQDNEGKTALHLAAQYEHLSAINMLLCFRLTNVNTTDVSGQSPIFSSLSGTTNPQTQVAVFQQFLDHSSVDIHETDSKGETILHKIARDGNVSAARILLDRKDVRISAREHEHGYTPLHLAIRELHSKLVKVFLSREDIQMNGPDKYGNAPLHILAKSNTLSGKTEGSQSSSKREEGRDIVSMLLARNDVQVNKAGVSERTPLHEAIIRSNMIVVKQLLARSDIDVNIRDGRGETPLHTAVRMKCVDAAKLLLERIDIQPDVWTSDEETPLHLAARNDCVEVAKLLLSRDDVDVEACDGHGQTPLHLAAKSDSIKVAKLLLLRDNVDVGARTITGKTPLYMAIDHDSVEVAKLLLATDKVDACARNERQQTPLHHAAWRGSIKVAKFLLSRDDVDASSRDMFQKTPLHLATMYGSVQVAKLLISRDDVIADACSNGQQTPLHMAAIGRDIVKSTEVAKVLLERDDVNADARDQWQRTPLHLAANAGVAELLISRNDVNVRARDHQQRTPLHWAASRNGVKVAKLLLARENVEADARDIYEQTPLHCAAAISEDKVDVAKLLLARKDVNINARGKDLETPLHVAATRGSVQAAKLLLARDDVNADARDKWQKTPLHLTASAGVAELLISRNDVNICARDHQQRTPLHGAASKNFHQLAKLLLARENVEADALDINQETPLHYAAYYSGNKTDVAELLLARKDVNINAPGKDLKTPLHFAAEKNNVEVAKLLLAREDISAEPRDVNGMTPVHTAAAKGSSEVAEVLLATDGVDANARDSQQRTALHHAALGDYHDVAELLLSIVDVDVDAHDLKGNSALDVAKEGDASACVALLEKFMAENAHSET